MKEGIERELGAKHTLKVMQGLILLKALNVVLKIVMRTEI